MKTALRRSLKLASDACIRVATFFIPKWSGAQSTMELPAVPAYQLPLPLNAPQLPTAYQARFGESVSLPERRVYLLRDVYASWHGVVFKNLRLFRPSISPLVTLESEFSAGFLLRQWKSQQVPTVGSNEVVGLAHGPWSVGNYYHWMIDTLPRLLFLQRHYPDCRLLVPDPLPASARQTVAIFGFKHLLPLTQGTVVKLPQLAVPDYAACSGYQDAAVIQPVRETVLRALGLSGERPADGRRIYVSRSRQPIRRLLNEAAIGPLLREYGFETVFFEDLTFEEQVRLLHGTSVLVGVHGANLTNMLFMAPHATVVELMNVDPNAFNSCYYHLAFALKLDYYNVPCYAQERTPANANSNSHVTVEVEALRQVLSTIFCS